VPLHVIDTAGLRDTQDEVERIGVARSWDAIADADVVLFLRDLSRIGQPDYDNDDAAIQQRLSDAGIGAARVLQVFNKADLGSVLAIPDAALSLSAKTSAGLPELRQALLRQVGWHATPEGVYIARQRHVSALQRTREHLQLAQDMATLAIPALDLLAEELRLAHDALGEITGTFTSDDLLGEIFSRFCIGK
jgi:tRNA modification GTPase